MEKDRYICHDRGINGFLYIKCCFMLRRRTKQHANGGYYNGSTDYTSVIYPAKSIMELAHVEKRLKEDETLSKEQRDYFAERYELHMDSLTRAMDRLVSLDRNFDTEGQGTFEDGANSCSATQYDAEMKLTCAAPNMMNSPHGWSAWNIYALFNIYELTGDVSYLERGMNAMGSCAQLNIINLRISAAHLNHFIKCLFIAEHVKRKNAHILPLKGVWAF